APVILIAGNHDTPRSSETGSILRLFEELGIDVASDEARRFVYPALDLSVLAVPHQLLTGAARSTVGRFCRSTSSRRANGATWPWATIMSSTGWRRECGTPDRSST